MIVSFPVASSCFVSRGREAIRNEDVKKDGIRSFDKVVSDLL